MNHFSLFTGIGGIDLAAEWAGFTSVGQCEWADFQTKVLEKHWPNVPRWRDVRDVTAESIRAAGIEQIDLLSGGYPCQPFSLAGKREGAVDDRHLWPEMFRIIQEVRPTWVLGENVAGHVTMGINDVLSDLESEGYEAQSFIIPACAVDAKHRRDRVFIVAYSNSHGDNGEREHRINGNRQEEMQKRIEPQRGSSYEGEVVADSTGKGFQERRQSGISPGNQESGTRLESELERCGEDVANSGGGRYWLQEEQICTGRDGFKYGGCWSVEPELGRVANGIPNRVDRLKSLGNAVVPQQVYPILKAIWEVHHAYI